MKLKDYYFHFLFSMYTSKDVEDELVSMLKPHRKREYLDKRNYLIGILSHKYNMTEDHISSITYLEWVSINTFI